MTFLYRATRVQKANQYRKECKMNILLIQPPVEDFYNTPIRTFPLGLAYIAGALRAQNFSVAILDCHEPQVKIPLPLPEEFSFIKDFYPSRDSSPFCLFSTYYHFGLSWEQIEEEIRQRRPDIVGISSNFTPYFNEAFRVAQIAKKVDTRIKTIFGGAHVNSMPERVLAHSEIDFIVCGEGEKRFVELVTCLRDAREVKGEGIGYKKNGKIFVSKASERIDNLEEIPLPAFDLLHMEKYMIGNKRYAMLLTSRGCPQECTFCSTHLTMGKKFRIRSAQSIVDEMVHVYKEHTVRIFDIEDDNFTYDRERLVYFLDRVKKTFPNNDIQLKAMNGLSLRNLDDETLKMLAQCGLHELNIALVSHSQQNITTLQRPHAFEEFDAVIQKTRALDMFITAYIILGLPDDSLDTMCDSICLLSSRPVLIGPSIFYPTPGTKIYTQLKRRRVVCDEKYRIYRSSLAAIETDAFSRVDIMTLMKIVRMVNFLKSCADRYGKESKISLRKLLSSIDDINIDGSSVETVDASALQLLIVLVNECKAQGKKIIWHKKSEKIIDSAKLLNLTEALGI